MAVVVVKYCSYLFGCVKGNVVCTSPIVNGSLKWFDGVEYVSVGSGMWKRTGTREIVSV